MVAADLDERDAWPRAPWDVPSAPRSLVVGGDGLYHQGQIVSGIPRNFVALTRAIERLGVDDVWVHEGALEPLGWPDRLSLEEAQQGLAHPFFADVGDWQSRSPGVTHYAYWYRKGAGGFHLNVPGLVPRRMMASAFAGTETAWELVWAVNAYQEATEGAWQWAGTASVTSDRWIRERWRRRRGFLAVTETFAPFLDGLATEGDINWFRQPTAEEERARYLFAFDANGAFLSAASALSLPVGPMRPATYEDLAESQPGYWLIEPPAWEGPLPCPWYTPPEGTATWVTTPTAWLARQRGVEPLEGYIWPDHHRHLTPWYEALRDARQTVDVGGPALAAIKSLYKAGLGRLSSTRRSRAAEGDPLYQPYWEQAVTAQARCNIWRRLAKLGAVPVAVDVDAFYFLTSSRTAAAFAARIGLPLGDGLGEYKPKGDRAPAAEAREVLATLRSPAGVARKFDELTGAR